LIAALTLPTVAAAETVYVAERLRLPLRAEPTAEAAVVKTVESGEKLEVIERQENFAHVRDAQGNEGWVDGRWLATQPGAAAQLSAARAELTRVKQQLAEAPARSAPAGEPAPEVAQLKTELAAARAQVAELQAGTSGTPADGASAPTSAEGPGFSFVWLGISFAMLVLGFIGGVVWVRESIRRRMGGLYLRI
jgi:hypothetical protein